MNRSPSLSDIREDALVEAPLSAVSAGIETRHDTVLLEEAVSALHLAPGAVVVDATVGGAGHFRAIRDALSPRGVIVGIDADGDALVRAQSVADGSPLTVHLVQDNFRNLGRILRERGIETIDAALFDLGWSSFHLSSGRGFSFKSDEPLLMTYGAPRSGETAADLVNTAEEEVLADIFHTFGEERFARNIARGIVGARKHARILSTRELSTVIEESVPAWYRHRRLHPATKTFQALRIAVNDELGALREGLSAAIAHLKEEGRVAVITFHSIEDRIVKSMFRDAAHEGRGIVLTKKPLVPSERELSRNPRSRSAKLRVFEKSAQTLSSLGGVSPYTYA